jgi:F420-dependent oxidoreductase-like protein
MARWQDGEMRLGYQMPLFDHPGLTADKLFANIVEQSLAAEQSGFDTVLVMDHMYQLPQLGRPQQWMLECYTLLAGIAASTSTVRLSSLVTGNTYRNPALLAKTLTTLDIISGGRASLGIGAGWFEREHVDYGWEFGTFTDRFEKLEEALNIILPMLRGERPTVSGKHYATVEAINEPQPLSRIPVMIGGGGEKKTLRMVAQYADESNLICAPNEIAQKLDVLDEHCERLGRPRSEVTVTWQRSLVVGETMEQARGLRDAALRRRGVDPITLGDVIEDRLPACDRDTLGEMMSRYLSVGLDGFTINLTANGGDPDMVELVGQVLAPLVNV